MFRGPSWAFSLNCTALSHFSRVGLCATLWTLAHQAPLSMGFSRHEHWSGLPCPPPGDLPDPGIKPSSLVSPWLAGGFLTTSTIWEVLSHLMANNKTVVFYRNISTVSNRVKQVKNDTWEAFSSENYFAAHRESLLKIKRN